VCENWDVEHLIGCLLGEGVNPKDSSYMATLFFSYSHKDEALRDELEIHFSMLKREGTIEAWHDRRIGAGREFDGEISQHLEEADIILLLVSPYFLASDYCFDVEMTRAIERHEKGEARVIPVILHPCDWKNAPFGKLLAVPRDGKPVSKYPNQHDAFLEVVEAVRGAVQEFSPGPDEIDQQIAVHQSKPQRPTSQVRSSNLRIRKEFSDHEKDRFRDESFEYLANFFENSLAELGQRNVEVSSRFGRIDAQHFSAVVYINGQKASECRIWMGSDVFGGDIMYSSNASGSGNSFNESMSVEDDGHALFLKPMGMSYAGRGEGRDKLLSQHGAAEYFWEMLVQRLQD
jgi:hypothetical protein